MLKAALSRMASEFTQTELTLGQDYQQRGYVLSIRLSDGLLKGRVKDGTGKIYDVYLDLKTWPQSRSRCTCNYLQNCKHAVASLLAFEAKERFAQTGQVAPQPITYTSSAMSTAEVVADVEDLDWFSHLNEQGHAFFGYELGIMIDSKPVSILPFVIKFLTTIDANTLERLPDNKQIKLPIAANRVLTVELGRLKPLLRVLMQYSGADFKPETGLEIQPYQLLLMQEAEQALAATNARWVATTDLSARMRALLNVVDLPEVPLPRGLNAVLRDYQQQGLNWLQFLQNHQFGGVLADDMGLGKTIQTLALLQHEKEQGRLNKASLIVAPTSLVGNWFEEAQRFTPSLRILVFHGQERQTNFDDYDLVISTYGLVQRDKTIFTRYPFYYLILDEAQFIKNFKTKTTQIIYQLQAKYRLCLTGTPLENHLGELWSLFHFLMPGLLGTAKQFRQLFRIPIEKQRDMTRQQLLMRRIQPFILRRTKNQVTRELPAKTEMLRMVELSGPQRDLYEAIRLSMEEKVRAAIQQQGLGKSQIVLLDALLKLRQICCDPRLLSLPQASMAHGHSAKLDVLLELLDSLMDEGRRVLVFSQFTSMLKLIEAELVKRDYPYFKLTGQTQNRAQLVQRFQAGEVPIFLISLKAGGVGLNLTRADTVILYDPWWNPAVQDQAMDRSHRIGQENPVFVYKLITTGTVEEVMLEMQTTKRALFSGILSQPVTEGWGLTEVDIAQFFAALE